MISNWLSHNGLITDNNKRRPGKSEGSKGVRLFTQPNLVVIILVEEDHLRVAQVFALLMTILA